MCPDPGDCDPLSGHRGGSGGRACATAATVPTAVGGPPWRSAGAEVSARGQTGGSTFSVRKADQMLMIRKVGQMYAVRQVAWVSGHGETDGSVVVVEQVSQSGS